MTSTDAHAVRPRIEGDREREILRAALEVLADVGYDRLTMDAVAARARASKATLYRRWNTKVGLVIDALLVENPAPTVPDTGSLRGDLVAAFCGVGGLVDARQVGTFSSVLTALTHDLEFAAEFRGRVLGPRIEATREVYERARARGEVRPDLDLELFGPALAGICLHRFYVLGEPPTPELVARVIDQIIVPAATASGSPTTEETHA